MMHPCGLSPQHAERAFTFIPPFGFATQRLAHVLDSLVRVSRRVGGSHFASIRSAFVLDPVYKQTMQRHCMQSPHTPARTEIWASLKGTRFDSSVRRTTQATDYNTSTKAKVTFLQLLSRAANRYWPALQASTPRVVSIPTASRLR